MQGGKESVAEKLEDVRWIMGHLKLSKATVFRMLKGREIPFFKVGHSIRFRPSAVEKWLREQRVSTGDGG